MNVNYDHNSNFPTADVHLRLESHEVEFEKKVVLWSKDKKNM